MQNTQIKIRRKKAQKVVSIIKTVFLLSVFIGITAVYHFKVVIPMMNPTADDEINMLIMHEEEIPYTKNEMKVILEPFEAKE